MNKNIVITGVTGVLGSLTAKTFAAMGHKLALLDKDQEKLDSLVRDLNLPSERLYAQTVNLLNGQAVQDSAEAILSKFGSLHGLIHLVGGWAGGKSLVEAPAAELEAMLNQHVWTTFHLYQSFSPQLAASQAARVIVVSKSSVPVPAGKEGLYSAAKAAQENLTLTLAAELKPHGGTANILQVQSIDAAGAGKGTSPAELVAAMQYLFSEEAARLTGARIPLYA